MKNILRRKTRIVGMAFLILLSILGTTIAQANNDWEIALDNKEWSASAGSYTGWTITINKPATLKMVLATIGDIHLYVFNDVEYTKWTNLLYAEGYIWKDIYTGIYTCILHTTGVYHIILDNMDSIITPKSGTISLLLKEYKSPIGALLIVVVGLLIFGVIALVISFVIRRKGISSGLQSVGGNINQDKGGDKQMIFCVNCGNELGETENFCQKCGAKIPLKSQVTAPVPQQSQNVAQNITVQVAPTVPVRGTSPKNRTVVLFLCIFLGIFGFHRFYVGKVGTGILYLFTTGVFGIGWIIDILMILGGNFGDSFGNPITEW